MKLTQEYLKECLEYDPETGLFIWKSRPIDHFADSQTCKMWNTRYSGLRAGYLVTRRGKTYRDIKLLGKAFRVHQLVFLYVKGFIPEVIDHINGDGTDNRFNNLRLCSKHENCLNRSLGVNSSTKAKGVSLNTKSRALTKYVVRVRYKSKGYEIGCTSDFEEAKWLYNEATKDLHGEFHRPNKTSFKGENRFKNNKFFSIHLPRLLEEKKICST